VIFNLSRATRSKLARAADAFRRLIDLGNRARSYDTTTPVAERRQVEPAIRIRSS